MIRDHVRAMIDDCVRAEAAFIRPKPDPCGVECASYNQHGQCPECGWLRPYHGDQDLLPPSFRGVPIREMPLGPYRPGVIGMTDEEIAYMGFVLG